MLISIHIPKTGGTSFKHTLKGVYGEEGLFHLPTTKQWNQSNVNELFVPKSTECIHGHMQHDAFDEIHPEASKILWLRDPVYRTISLYNHILSFPDTDNENHIEVHESNISLVDFSGLPWVKNNTLNYIRGTNPEDFLFIGFMEAYEASLMILTDLLGWDDADGFRTNVFNENVDLVGHATGKGVHKNSGQDHSNASDQEKNIILNNNKEEYEWLLRAHEFFSKKFS